MEFWSNFCKNFFNKFREGWELFDFLLSLNLRTILILEKFNRPSSVKLGVPSSMNDRSVRYMPRYGMHGGSHLCSASLRFRNLPSADTMVCSFSIVCLVCNQFSRSESGAEIFILAQTVFETFSQVFLRRNTELLVKAAQICRTPLKLCKHRLMSATAAHFSIAAILAARLSLLTISDTTSRDTSLKRLVISKMWRALFTLSVFIHACPKNSLNVLNYFLFFQSRLLPLRGF